MAGGEDLLSPALQFDKGHNQESHDVVSVG